ncbi:MAG: acyl carrier protein [Streptococcus sanguinis]|jgi:hypothetical protein|uniref:Acyl carrier protein n=1 Tax=Streptococcus sanguinis TaxID=1305 RepID=A0AAJ5NN85_STRSA|nr:MULTISPECIES: acyl carrier protein [Streptococcus]MBF1700291.1 acyl carrier protein [Streptococcus sanguinis]MBF1702819.1 acyl carrier protein [Streptococcus sanguinis]MBZ2067089.1 acyl carrier protein [Streptococcus sanguinis]MCY7013196.1 acyl carrier protein [Streptococcus sanguinis]RSH97966.1 Acyl carrier protein [Streptococcus sanguinis]
MSEKEIYAKIVEIIQEHDSRKLHITPELSLKEELGVDSVDLMEFIINLEEAFDIEIPDEDMDNFKTISDVVAYIHEKLKKQH